MHTRCQSTDIRRAVVVFLAWHKNQKSIRFHTPPWLMARAVQPAFNSKLTIQAWCIVAIQRSKILPLTIMFNKLPFLPTRTPTVARTWPSTRKDQWHILSIECTNRVTWRTWYRMRLASAVSAIIKSSKIYWIYWATDAETLHNWTLKTIHTFDTTFILYYIEQ